jgi:hypothetical protein
MADPTQRVILTLRLQQLFYKITWSIYNYERYYSATPVYDAYAAPTSANAT